MNLFSEIETYVSKLNFREISASRKSELEVLARYCSDALDASGIIRLNFICTHNSRRSQFAQVWAQTAAAYYEVPLLSYSGGTEVTAFNFRAVNALERVGFHIESSGDSNPQFLIAFSPEAPALSCYSKLYNDASNPLSGYAAVMTCSEADANCPYIPGASYRFLLSFDDPGITDGTDLEQRTYDERCEEIASQMFYLFRLV